jgi:RNA polymerase sigma factor (sigma-70 family)
MDPANLATQGDSELIVLIQRAKHRQNALQDNISHDESETRAIIDLGKEAWGALFERHMDNVTAFARYRRLPREISSRRPSAATFYGLGVTALTIEEFVNEVYERMWTRCKLASYKPIGLFRAWLSVVLNTIYSDIFRERKKETSAGQPINDGLDDGMDAVTDERTAFSKAITSLSLPYRVTFKLAFLYYLDLTREEIRFIARESDKTESEVLNTLTSLHDKVLAPLSVRAEGYHERLASTSFKIEDQQKKLREISEQIELLQEHSNVAPSEIDQAMRKKKAMEERIQKQFIRRLKLKQQIENAVKMPSRDIAKILNINADAVDQRLSRVRRTVRKHLGDVGYAI